MTHPDLSQLDFGSCLREMTESRRTLEQLTGTSVRTFAYPYCRYGRDALEAARAAGFDAAVTCQGHGSWEPYALKRSLITGKDALPTFLLKLTDMYQPLFDSLPARMVRSATRGARERHRERAEARGTRVG